MDGRIFSSLHPVLPQKQGLMPLAEDAVVRSESKRQSPMALAKEPAQGGDGAEVGPKDGISGQVRITLND